MIECKRQLSAYTDKRNGNNKYLQGSESCCFPKSSKSPASIENIRLTITERQ